MASACLQNTSELVTQCRKGRVRWQSPGDQDARGPGVPGVGAACCPAPELDAQRVSGGRSRRDQVAGHRQQGTEAEDRACGGPCLAPSGQTSPCREGHGADAAEGTAEGAGHRDVEKEDRAGKTPEEHSADPGADHPREARRAAPRMLSRRGPTGTDRPPLGRSPCPHKAPGSHLEALADGTQLGASQARGPQHARSPPSLPAPGRAAAAALTAPSPASGAAVAQHTSGSRG
ncbi:neuromodulin-like [Saccopteryx leptura]|uniref:neuromodulin-like n=1 Tax=Saccopteryx leptura TaxID=249018 RepID=UPI00339BC0CB